MAANEDLAARFGRSDPGFLALAAAYLPLIDELLANYDAESLRALARFLPLRSDIQTCICPTLSIAFGTGRSAFEAWTSRATPNALAIYCAVAAQGMLSRELSEIEQMFIKIQRQLAELIQFTKDVSVPRTKLLAEAVRRGGKDT